MKALIISDDEFFVSQSVSFLKENDFDVIIYKWLLKALDNIEEIHPDLIILSTNEYPRHWKTLVQFVKSGIGGEKIFLCLYEPLKLSEDDEEKAKVLGINGYFRSFSSDELYEVHSSIVSFFGLERKAENLVPDLSIKYIESSSGNNQVYEEEEAVPTVENIIQTNNFEVENKIPSFGFEESFSDKQQTQEDKGYILLNSPLDFSLIPAAVLDFSGDSMKVMFDSEVSPELNNQLITQISYMNKNNIFGFSANLKISEISNNACTLTIKERYEEI